MSSGVKVVYSQPRLKIHAKLFLIERKQNDIIMCYAHIGSGNFSEKQPRYIQIFYCLLPIP